MYIACQTGQLKIVQWLRTHGAATDVMRKTFEKNVHFMILLKNFIIILIINYKNYNYYKIYKF